MKLTFLNSERMNFLKLSERKEVGTQKTLGYFAIELYSPERIEVVEMFLRGW